MAFAISGYYRQSPKIQRFALAADVILITACITTLVLKTLRCKSLVQLDDRFVFLGLGSAAFSITIADGLTYGRLKRKKAATVPKSAHKGISEQNKGSQPATENAVFSTAQKIILFMSISGNPTHFGHLQAIERAYTYYNASGKEVEHAFLSIAPQSYVNSKTRFRNGKSSFQYHSFSQGVRAECAKKTIEISQKKQIVTCPVEFWDDQDQGNSDHPESYKRLVNKFPNHKIVLVAGADLCKSMHNWSGLAHAVIMTRGDGTTSLERSESGTIIRLKENGYSFVQYNDKPDFSRIILESDPASPYTSLSSSQCQLEKYQSLPKEVQDILSTDL